MNAVGDHYGLHVRAEVGRESGDGMGINDGVLNVCMWIVISIGSARIRVRNEHGNRNCETLLNASLSAEHRSKPARPNRNAMWPLE